MLRWKNAQDFEDLSHFSYGIEDLSSIPDTFPKPVARFHRTILVYFPIFYLPSQHCKENSAKFRTVKMQSLRNGNEDFSKKLIGVLFIEWVQAGYARQPDARNLIWQFGVPKIKPPELKQMKLCFAPGSDVCQASLCDAIASFLSYLSRND